MSGTRIPPKPKAPVAPKKGSEFVCKIRYSNPLPDVPYSTKLMPVPFKERQLSEIVPVNKSNPYPRLIGKDFQEMIDLVNLSVYDKRKDIDKDMLHPDLDQAEMYLLEDPEEKEEFRFDSAKHRPEVTWLRRTEYLSKEGSRLIGRNKQTFKKSNNEDEVMSIAAQIDLIEKTFIEKDLVHPTDSSLKPQEVFSVFPDFQLWGNKYLHCVFDDDPSTKPLSKPRSQFNESDKKQRKPLDDQLEESILKMQTDSDDSGQNFLIHFIPTEDATVRLKRRAEEEPDLEEVYEFEAKRNYSFRKSKEQKCEKFCLVFRPTFGAFYNVIDERMVLNKRRATNSSNVHSDETPTHLNLKLRELNDDEQLADRQKLQHDLLIEVDATPIGN